MRKGLSLFAVAGLSLFLQSETVLKWNPLNGLSSLDALNAGGLPIARYGFNDPTDLGHDSGRFGYDLTPVNTPTATGGATGYAADFEDGSSQSALGADTATLAGKSVAWAAWVRPETITAGGIAWLSKGDGVEEGEFLSYVLSGGGTSTCRVQDSVGTKTDTITTVSNGERVFLSCRYSVTDDDIEAGKNATWSGSPTTVQSDLIDTAVPIRIAAREGPSLYWDGVIGTTLFYVASSGDALTDAIATSLYNSGKGMTCEAAEAAGLRGSSGVSCWNMTEDGGPYVDSWGSNNLTGVNTPTQAAALVEQPDSGMSVNLVAASTQYLTANSAALGSGSFSVSAWVNTGSVVGTQGLISLGSASWANTAAGSLYASGQSVICLVGNGAAFAAETKTNTLNSGEWVHLACTFDAASGVVTLYIDSTPGGAPDTLAGTKTAQTKIAVGQYRDAAGGEPQAAIDQVTIWNYDIGQLGVTKDYNAGVGIFYAFDWTWEDPLKRFAFSMPKVVKTPREETTNRGFHVR